MENEYARITNQLTKYGTVQGIMSYVNENAIIKQHKKQPKNKATGIDKVTKTEYDKNLQTNVKILIEKMKTMSYKPQPVKRVYIPKDGSNEKRPLGIPAYEDRLVQGAMTEILTVIYETKFLDCSYGFRPNRDCHQAIKRLDSIIMRENINWIVDADIKGFFNNVVHEKLIELMEKTIEDKTFIRYIIRILKSGIMEGTIFEESDKGTPQGGLISPVLANIYLHYVLDTWFNEKKAELEGKAFLIRYADDFACCFEKEEEARKFYEELKERMEEYGLQLAEDKSRIIPFGNKENKETFDFLGFTHRNGKNRKGKYKLIHQTSKKKTKSKRKAVAE